jgi:hypothetical protein
MRAVGIALGAGLLLTAIAIGVVLSRSPYTVAGTNSVFAEGTAKIVYDGQSGCQTGETLPRGTSAIRVSLSANVGPRVAIRVLDGSRVLTQGERAAGWGVAETVTVPVRPLSRAIHNVRVCTSTGRPIENLQINGTPASSRSVKGNLDGVTLRMEYLRPGTTSWLSLARATSRRLGLGRAASGTWIVFVLLALMITVAGLASRLTYREMR